LAVLVKLWKKGGLYQSDSTDKNLKDQRDFIRYHQVVGIEFQAGLMKTN